MYLPLSKFQSIHWVSIDATVQNNFLTHNRDLDTQALVVPALAPVPFFIVFIYFTSIFISSYKPGFPIRDSRPPSVLVAKNEILRPAPADTAANAGSSPPCQPEGPRVKDDHTQTSHPQPSRHQTDFLLGKPDISEAAPGSGP